MYETILFSCKKRVCPSYSFRIHQYYLLSLIVWQFILHLSNTSYSRRLGSRVKVQVNYPRTSFVNHGKASNGFEPHLGDYQPFCLILLLYLIRSSINIKVAWQTKIGNEGTWMWDILTLEYKKIRVKST